MVEFRRHYPRPGRRTVKGVFVESDVLSLSLEAAGLAVHILSFEADDIDSEFLARMFPGRDLSGPIRELASIGMIAVLDEADAAAAPRPAGTEPREAVARSGSIYIVEGAGRYKVGIAKSATVRLSSLQTGSPFPLRLVRHAFVPDSAEAERLAHALLAKYRLHGEWFDCSEEQALSAFTSAVEAVGPRA